MRFSLDDSIAVEGTGWVKNAFFKKNIFNLRLLQEEFHAHGQRSGLHRCRSDGLLQDDELVGDVNRRSLRGGALLWPLHGIRAHVRG